MTDPTAREQRALLPCDYCGSTTGAEPIKDNRKLWSVRCSCGLHSTWHTRRYGAIEAWNERIERHRLSSVKSAAFADAQPPRENSHPDDAAVDLFAAQMKAKLAVARAKGRGGWDDPSQCSVETLRTMLHEHIGKGDPVDVANFCMMLAHYGASTVQPPREEVAVPVGMKPWAGGDSAPADWDRRSLVRFRDKSEQIWPHVFGWSNIIAYTPTSPAGEVVAPVQAEVERAAAMEALAGYRAAVSFIAADAWDGCSDCIEVLRQARAADWANDQAADPDETARQLARIRQHGPALASLPTTEATGAGEGLRDALERIANSERTAGIYDTLGNASIARQALAGEKA